MRGCPGQASFRGHLYALAELTMLTSWGETGSRWIVKGKQRSQHPKQRKGGVREVPPEKKGESGSSQGTVAGIQEEVTVTPAGVREEEKWRKGSDFECRLKADINRMSWLIGV